jgi:sulfopyruvate decarboxylase subunit beta
VLTSSAAISAVFARLDDEDLVVAANGSLSREAWAAAPGRGSTFTMIGSMGLAGAIGLGLAMAVPHRRVVVIDGDGNLLMGLGCLPMVAERAPERFLHLVLDNQAYASTGGQRSITDTVDLAAVAAGAGYRHVRTAIDSPGLEAALDHLLGRIGPGFLLVKVVPVAAADLPRRVPLAPADVADRFRGAVAR